MNDNIISVNQLSFKYDEEQVKPTIDNVSFDVRDGEWLAVIGHNGSGKSTIAKLLVGLLDAAAGAITVAGQTLDETTVWKIRRHVGLVFQNPDNQFVGATVEDDVAFGLENAGVPREEMIVRVEAALEQVGMSAFRDKEPSNLSGGQKQRVAIAGILALQPKVIILDEATSMLDPDGREEVMAVIRQIKEEKNLTVISITHDIDEAAEADRVLVVREGQVLTQNTPEEIFAFGKNLIEIGLDVPFGEKLKAELAMRGVPIPEGYTTTERLVEWLCKLNSNM